MTIQAQNRSLLDWFARIRLRQTVLPRFQRFEAWSHSAVSQIFNTILQDLPIGALLVLEIGDEQPFIWRSLVGAPTEGERITEHLLDGQQRLTALWRGLHNNYESRTYFLYLVPDEETGMPYYVDSLGRWQKEKDRERRPFWANDPKQQWERRAVPLDLLCPTEEAHQAYRNWAREAIEDADEREDTYAHISQIRQKFVGFNLPYLSLPVTTSKDTALDVFIKMNTSAAPLSTFDIVVAQVEAGMGTSLHELVAETKQRCPTITNYYPPEGLTLTANALLQERTPSSSNFLAKDFGSKVIENWERFEQGVIRTAAFLEEERVFDERRIPTDVVVPVLVALWADAPDRLDAEGRARFILRQYLWRSFFSGRYEKDTSNRALADYRQIKKLIEGSAEQQPLIFDEEAYPLPQPDELIAAGWPTKKDRLARAILALALRQGGLDMADGSTVSRDNLARREYHHLFPHALLRDRGVPDEHIFRSLNCALVTWQTNRNISAKEPERYLAERRSPEDPDDAEIRRRLDSHLIPYDELVSGDYDAFLARRAELAHEAMLELCGSETASARVK